MERKLATIQQIDDVKSIPNADKICAYRVNGWWIVDTIDKYKIGDLVIYLEIDSWVPHEIAPFLSKGKEPREYNDLRGERLKTVKLRGQLSQGLLLPTTVLDVKGLWPLAGGNLIGHDLTVQLGIHKWEAPILGQLRGVMKGNFPSFIPKTDQPRCQNLRQDIFIDHKDETYEVTLKLDGSSMTIYVRNGEVGVCSRNIDLQETEENSFWKATRNQNIIQPLLEYSKQKGANLALQGELIGEGIQGNIEKITGQRFYLFDIYDIDNGCYLHPSIRYSVLDSIKNLGADIEHVPIIEPFCDVATTYRTIDDLLDFAEGPSLNPKTKREGLVFKSHNSNFTFKAISNSYLLKHGDR
jgi:RNA ligase (TIGR02306 family)